MSRKNNVIYSSVKMRSIIKSLDDSRDAIVKCLQHVKDSGITKMVKSIKKECNQVQHLNEMMKNEIVPLLAHPTASKYCHSRLNNLFKDTLPHVQSALVKTPCGRISRNILNKQDEDK